MKCHPLYYVTARENITICEVEKYFVVVKGGKLSFILYKPSTFGYDLCVN